MIRSRATVSTAHGGRYLQQLCKHWSHRFETVFDETAGRVALPLGEARFAADPGFLTIDLAADGEAALEGLREVVVRHLERFAFRETLAIDWDRIP